MYGMRRSFNRTLIQGDAEFRIDPESLTSDIADFFQASDDVERLTALHTGPFLDGFHLSDAPEFDQWAARQRDRTTGRFASALEVHARNAFAMGNYEVAIVTWRRRVALEPFEPVPTMELMKALAASGDRSGAVRQARAYQTLIQSEEDMDADPAVADLADQIQKHETFRPMGPRGAALAVIAKTLWPHPALPDFLAVGDVTTMASEDSSGGEIFSEMLAALLKPLRGLNVLSTSRGEQVLDGPHSIERTLEVLEGSIYGTRGHLELELHRVDLRTGVTRRVYRVGGTGFRQVAQAAVLAIANDFGISLE